MRTGLIVSAVGHLALVLAGVISLRGLAPLDATEIEALPIDLVEIDDVTNLSQGIRSAEANEKASPNDPTEAETPPEKPIPAPEPVAEAEPTPPPPPPPPAAPPPEPAPPVEEAKPEPAPPPPAPVAEAPPPEPEPPPPEPPQPAPEEAAKPEEAPPPVKADVPAPRPRPNRPAPPTPEQKDAFDTDRIAALLDKSKPAPAAAPSNAPAALGTKDGSDATRLTQNELDGLRAQVEQCWIIPTGWTDPKQVSVTIRFALERDGTVKGNPEVVEYPASQYGQVSADNAIRAVLRCGPYRLPVEKYDQWSEVQLRFTPPI
jgi:hypothetical protein